jgi:acyl-CoA synthetase (AMP-forming)/AMP-acid ligase II
VLYEHKAVAEACVFAMPDEKWGESVGAHIVLRRGESVTSDQLNALCSDRLAGFKRPRVIEFVESLPKNANGKLQRRKVQDQYWVNQNRKVN